MKSEEDIINPIFDRSINRRLAAIRGNPNVLEENKNHTETFMVACQSKRLKKATISKQLQRLQPFIEFAGGKDFKSFTRFDIDKFLAAHSASASSWTLDSWIVFIQLFYRHLFGLTSADPLPDCVRHLKRPRGKTSIRKKDLFTADEIKRIIEATGSIYERVLCEVLAETAARPGEFRSLKTSDVTMAADSVTLRIRGGKMEEKGERDVYVLNPEFIKDFSLWFKTHPNRATGSWLFYDITDATRPIAWSRASLIIKRAAATAGVNGRPIKLYLFRHSLLHELYKKYPTEAVRRAAGHAPGSPMPSVYCHADSDDIKTMLMEGRGLQHEVSEKDFILMTLRFKKHPQEFFKVMEDRLKELEG